MTKRVWLFAVAVVVASVAGASLLASLLGLTLGKPTTSFANPSSVHFTASTGVLSITATPTVERFASGSVSLFPATPAPSLTINVHLKADGTVDPASYPGNDLVLLGKVVDGATTYDSSVGGPLLTGEMIAFGYQDGGVGVADGFDFKFTVTGGQLAGYFAGQDIGVSVSSDVGNTFLGVFTSDFDGNAKGTVGTVPQPPVCAGSIGDFVWHDHDGNGVQDANEEGINGVTVTLLMPDGITTQTDVTHTGPAGQLGYYQFTGLCAGNYQVSVETPAGYLPTVTGQGTTGNDSNATPSTVTLTTGNSTDQTIDFGFITQCASTIGDFVWNDANGNGVQDAGELGIANVTVQLLASDGTTVVRTTTTSASPLGYYSFDGLCAGTYYVKVTNPGTFDHFSPQYQGGDAATDSNVVPATGTTDAITVASNTTDLTIDIGLVPPPPCSGSMGDFVWNDLNGNGIQDAGEPGINGVTVELLLNGLSQGTTTTADHNGVPGWYQFSGLTCDSSYVVSVTTPGAYPKISPPTQGANVAIDSNGVATQDNLHSISAPVTLTSPTFSDQTVDFGFYACAGTIGDFVWNDVNQNGIQDPGEAGIAGVVLTLKDGNGASLNVNATTDANGHYAFTGLCPGNYQVVVLTAPAGMVASPTLQGANTAIDSNPSPAPVTLTAANSSNLTIDFGFYTPRPGVTIVKYTTVAGVDYDSNDPNGGTAGGQNPPHLQPGASVTWTYRVTNTGQTIIPKASVVVTDNTTGVTPTFAHTVSGSGDQNFFMPGDVWQFTATGTVLDLTQTPPAGVHTVANVCTDGGFLPPATAYVNLGTVTIPGATASDPASYCTNRTPDEPSPCPAGAYDAHVDANGDLILVYDQFPAPNDNSYGTTAVGWSTPAKGHKFSDLTGSDKAGFQLILNSTKAVKLSFNIDYLTLTTASAQFPSGYKSFGPFGGDGSIVTNSTPVALTNDPTKITWDTSLSRDLNKLGYFQLSGTTAVQTIGKPSTAGCTAAQATALTCQDLLINSPRTVNQTDDYTLVTPTPFTGSMTYTENGRTVSGWDFHDTYFVTLKKAYLLNIGLDTAKYTYDTNNTAAGYWTAQPNLTVLHNSPAKPCPTSTTGGSCNLSVGQISTGTKEVKITILNNSTTADAVLSALQLTWPSANGKLLKVLLDGDVVYDTPDIPWTSAGVTLGTSSYPLVTDKTKRSIQKGTSDVLHLQFEKNVVTDMTLYTSTASFGTGCDLVLLKGK